MVQTFTNILCPRLLCLFFAEAVASFAESTLISDLLVVRRPVFGKCPGKVRMHNKCRVLRHAECVHKSKIGADQVN